jgi:uncharacterized protein (TIRG00374 family)
VRAGERAEGRLRAVTSSRLAPRLRTGLVAAGFAATLVFAVFAIRDVDVHAAWNAVRESNQWWLGPALAVLALSILLRCVRWRYLFPPSTRPPLGAVISAYLVGQFFNIILPLRAGEAAGIIDLRRRAGTSRAETTGTVMIGRVFDVLALLTLLFVLAPWLPPVAWLHAAAVIAIVFAGGLSIVVALLAVFGERPVHLLVAPLRIVPWLSPAKIAELASNLSRGLAGARGARAGTIAFVLTALSWIVMGISFWLAALAFDLPRSLLLGILVVIATNLAQILPSAPAALGIFEAAAVVGVSAYGAPRSVALSYAVVLHAMNVFPYLIGAPIAIRQSRVSRVPLLAADLGRKKST